MIWILPIALKEQIYSVTMGQTSSVLPLRFISMPFTKYRRCPSFLGTSPFHSGTDHRRLRLFGRPQSSYQCKPEKLGAHLVYSCIAPTCTVKATRLASAHLNYITKPAIIFRIAACNDMGYGHATQVRWFQGMISKIYKVLVFLGH